MSSNRQDIKMYVEELIIAESGTYNDLFMRPYQTELSGSIIDTIEERYQKNRRFTPSMLANIANQFIVPDFRPRGIIEIPNGWNERRGRFYMAIDIHVGSGGRLKQIVLGYTNSVGFTLSNVDPDMEFYVNSTFMLQKKTLNNGRGGYEEVWSPVGVNDVLADHANEGLRGRSDKRFTIRPEDVYSVIDADQQHQLVDDLTDTRVTLSSNAIKSSVSNRLGASYMSRVLGARQKALENSQYGQPATELHATAQGYIQEKYTSEDTFLRAISHIRGLSTTVNNFMFRDLEDLDPDVRRRTDTILLDNDTRSATHYNQESNRLDGQEESDRIAALIQMAFPAIMMESGIHAMDFQIHNQLHGGQVAFIPENVRSFIKNVDLTEFMDRLEDRLIDELIVPITAGGRYDIGIRGSCRVFGEIDFTLYFDGENHHRFVLPCFCNSLNAPTVTDDRRDIRKLASDFNDLFDHFLPSDLAGGGYSPDGNDFGY